MREPDWFIPRFAIGCAAGDRGEATRWLARWMGTVRPIQRGSLLFAMRAER
jgi:hypothetical protein